MCKTGRAGVSSASKEYLINNYAEGEAIYTSLQLVSAFTGFVDLGASGATRVRNLLKDDIVKLGALNKTIQGDQNVADIYNKTQKFIDDISAVDADILTSIKTLQDLLGSLRSKVPTAHWSRFIDDFASDPAKLDIFDKTPGLTDAWVDFVVAGKNFASKDISILKKYKALNVEVKQFLIKLNDDAITENSSIAKFFNDLDDNFIEGLNSKPSLSKGVVGHKEGALMTADEYPSLSEELDDFDGINDVNKKLLHNAYDRSSGFNKFKAFAKLGNELNANIVSDILNNPNGRIISLLESKLKKTGLSQYQVFTEVPIMTVGGYMKADVVLIKRGIGNIIEDVVVIENKLSKGTRFTERQVEGFTAIKNEEASKLMKLQYDVTSQKGGSVLIKNSDLNIPKMNCIKISDHTTNDIANLNVSDFDLITDIIF